MGKNRVLFLILFGAYHLIIFFFTYYIDKEQGNSGIMLSMYEYISVFKYGSLFGLLLFTVDVAWSWQSVWVLRKEMKVLQVEINGLKGKLYDRLEDKKPTLNQQNSEEDSEEEEQSG